MQPARLWKVAATAAVVGVVALVATACAGVQTVTPTPKVAQNLILQANAVLGATGAPSPQDICIESNRFRQGEEVVFRIKVYNPATGQPMDDKALTSVVVSLKDGQTFKATYGGHPGGQGATPTDYFWSAVWSIPTTYPTGSVPYTVTATANDGRTGTFNDFNVGPSLLTVVAA
jgi:hypothetical protein